MCTARSATRSSSLEIFEHARDAAKVGGDRLVHRQDLQALLFDPHVPLVDLVVLGGHRAGFFVVRLGQFVDRLVDHLLDHGAHREDVVVQVVELACEVLASFAHPNRPVM